MNCPLCHSDNTVVLTTRPKHDGRVVWRRRQCNQRGCHHRWATEEMDAELIESLIAHVEALDRSRRLLAATYRPA